MKTKTSLKYLHVGRGRQSCSVLVSARYLPILKEKVQIYGSMRSVLHALVSKYSEKIEKIGVKNWNQYTIKYQAKNQGLKKINFYPNETDWLQMKLIATLLGVSIAHLFVLMFMMDVKEGDKSKKGTTGVHVKNPYISLFQNLSFLPHPIMIRKVRLQL